MEEPSRLGPDVLLSAHLRAGAYFLNGVAADRVTRRELPEFLESFRKRLCVARIGEESMVDRERRAGIVAVQADAPARARLHGEGGPAYLVARLARLDRGKHDEVADPLRAGRAPERNRDLAHEEGMLAREARGLVLEQLGWLPARPDSDVVGQPLADRQSLIRADPAPEQDRRRPVGARGEHDRVGGQLAR